MLLETIVELFKILLVSFGCLVLLYFIVGLISTPFVERKKKKARKEFQQKLDEELRKALEILEQKEKEKQETKKRARKTTKKTKEDK